MPGGRPGAASRRRRCGAEQQVAELRREGDGAMELFARGSMAPSLPRFRLDEVGSGEAWWRAKMAARASSKVGQRRKGASVEAPGKKHAGDDGVPWSRRKGLREGKMKGADIGTSGGTKRNCQPRYIGRGPLPHVVGPADGAPLAAHRAVTCEAPRLGWGKAQGCLAHLRPGCRKVLRRYVSLLL